MKDLIPYIVEKTQKSNARHKVYKFPSGAVMIDISIDDRLYVIQIDGESIGLSQITEEMGFDTIPDNNYSVANDFKDDFEKIFK